MSDLLNESVADAKAVKEAALANAKSFLEENFASSMKEMFAEKLREEMEEDEVSEDLGTSTIGGDDDNFAGGSPVGPSAVASKTSTDTSGNETQVVEEEGEESITNEELEEILAELGAEEPVAEVAEETVAEETVAEETVAEEAVVENEETVAEGEQVEEEINLDEILAELENEGDEVAAAAVEAPEGESEVAVAEVPSPMEGEECDVTSEEMAEAILTLNEENESLKNKLAQYEKAVKEMRDIISETNLLNAKLLYTNKLFKGKSLTEAQKLKVINTFDLTKNIREVKLAYTVLAESFNAGGSVVKKQKNTTAQTITEGLASKPVTSTKPEAAIVAPEASELASRLQLLAGIRK